MKSIKRTKAVQQTLYIKNMVCDRCIRVVRQELKLLGLNVHSIILGEARIDRIVTPDEIQSIQSVMHKNGFELIEDKNARMIEAVKTAIIQFVHHNHDTTPIRIKYSEYIEEKVGKEYHALSMLFSSVENVTIEHYIIRQRIERVKELLKYNEMPLNQIAFKMNYSSVQHLSNQFKSITGFTPGQFKRLNPNHHRSYRMSLDKVK